MSYPDGGSGLAMTRGPRPLTDRSPTSRLASARRQVAAAARQTENKTRQVSLLNQQQTEDVYK